MRGRGRGRGRGRWKDLKYSNMRMQKSAEASGTRPSRQGEHDPDAVGRWQTSRHSQVSYSNACARPPYGTSPLATSTSTLSRPRREGTTEDWRA